MLSIHHLLLAVCMTVFVCSVSGSRFCGDTPPVWRNDNITCPPRAVCSDVFMSQRDWYNGTRCQSKRILHNCLCQGNTVCPFNDENHMIYASSTHRRYTCEPKCQLPYCSNVPRQTYRRRLVDPTAVTAEQNSERFGGRTYYRIDCRCPRHHQPGWGRSRAVKSFANRYDVQLHQYSTLYKCDSRGSEITLPDPCSGPSFNMPIA